MAGLLQPWWLLALSVVPLIRWLHRRQAPLSTHTVSAVFLWQEDTAAAETSRHTQPPDPAWRRRAVIAALLALALATPWIERERQRLTIWIDDSLSMLVREDDATRSVLAGRSLADELQQRHYQEIATRRLSAGLPESLDADGDNWLVSDGADPRIRDWAGARYFDRVIQVGDATDNVGITRLAARRRADEPERLDLLVTVSNTGGSPAQRKLFIDSADGRRSRELGIEPGTSVSVQVVVPASATLHAALDSADPLRDDDYLRLPVQAFAPVTVAVDPDCAAPLHVALEVHPGLDVTAHGEPGELAVTCPTVSAAATAPGTLATIVALRGRATAVPNPAVWLPFGPSTGRPQLPAAALRATEWPGGSPPAGAQTILEAGGEPLVVSVRGSLTPRLLTVIDLGDPSLARRPEYAAFVATLVDAAAGRSLLDAVVIEGRDTEASMIRPQPIITADEAPPAVRHTRIVPVSAMLILAAACVLVLDAALLLVARRRAYRG